MDRLCYLGMRIKQRWTDIGWTGRAFLVTVLVGVANLIFATDK